MINVAVCIVLIRSKYGQKCATLLPIYPNISSNAPTAKNAVHHAQYRIMTNIWYSKMTPNPMVKINPANSAGE